MTLTPLGYVSRIIDGEVLQALKLFGAVEIRGPKWCGKTWTALNQGNGVVYIADPANDYAIKKLAILDPRSLLVGEHPLVIDEWQEAPGLWDAVRASVDSQRGKGLYILTGSSSPRKNTTVHTGTGRIAKVNMHPMTLFESGDSTAEISLANLFDNPDNTIRGRSSYVLDDVLNLAVRGGWPESIAFSAEDAAVLARQYIDSITDPDSETLKDEGISSEKLTLLVRSFARNTATLASNETLRKDITQGGKEFLSESGVRAYADYLKRIYLVWNQPAWQPSLRSATRLRTSPKRHLADPSLAVAALKTSAQQLKFDLSTFGFIFETLVARDLSVYAQALGGSLLHYRDNADLEVDAIVELDDGRYAGIEVKLGQNQEDEAAGTLLRFRRKMEAGHVSKPTFLAIIVGTGEFAHTRADGIHVIPIGCLAP